eukprot:scaffold14163_cov162-Skeletonema_marinoi.AAC.2
MSIKYSSSCHRCAEKTYGSFLPLPLAIEKLLSDHFIFVFAEGACSAAAGKDASRIGSVF